MVCQTDLKKICSPYWKGRAYLGSSDARIDILPILLNAFSSHAFNMVPPFPTRQVIKVKISNFIPIV